ncbi:MAG: lytic transglycosylase domain-containing protein [Pseudobdellovibrio sp.]
MRQKIILSVFIVTALLFQNFTSLDLINDPKYQIKKDSRLSHAKELLGQKFKKSVAAEINDGVSIEVEIYNLVKKHVPKQNQKDIENITKAILEESNKYEIDPVFIVSIIKTESSFNPNAKGTSGEIGLMQLMPKTGEYIAQKIKMKHFAGSKTLRDPIKNIKIGVAYINYLREKFDNTAYKYVPAYNMGPGKLTKSIGQSIRPKIYPAKVIKFYESFYKKIYLTAKSEIKVTQN